MPIGDNATNSNASRFTGTLDGQGYVISNLTITKSVTYAGLFGYADGARMKNVGLEETYINNISDNAGGICGYNNGIINNC